MSGDRWIGAPVFGGSALALAIIAKLEGWPTFASCGFAFIAGGLLSKAWFDWRDSR